MLPEQFVKKVVTSYWAGEGIFSQKVNAEELLPNTLNKKEKAQYIFFVLQIDYATKSQNLYKGAKELHEVIPNFFTPEKILGIQSYRLEALLRKYLHPRYINEAIKRYKYNSEVLLNNFGGDPRQLFINSDTCAQVLEKLRLFRGFGPKIGNFFVRVMINTYKYTFNDIDLILPPVDVHDVKIAYLMGYIESPKMTSKNIKDVKILWSEACKMSGFSWLTFDKALWLIGSEGRPASKEDIFTLIGN